MSATSDPQRGTAATIVHLTTVHRRDDIRVYEKMCKSAASAGHRVVLIAQAGPVPDDDGMEHVHLPIPQGRWRRLVHTQRAAWREVRRARPDIVHFHDPELLPFGTALRLRGYQVIYDAHEDFAKQILAKHWIPNLLRRPLSLTVEVVVQGLSRILDHVVTASEPIRHSFRSGQSTVIHNFPRLSEFDGVRRHDDGDSDRFASYLGGLTAVRGIAELVAAMEHVADPDVRLALAGEFSPAEFGRSVAALPGWNRTTMFGWLDRDGVADLLARSTLGFVVVHPTPNHLEGMPIKLFEYMAAGVPVVMSDFEHFRSMVGDIALFVDPFDPADIAQAVDWIVDHPAEAASRAERGRRLVEDELNWEREANKLLDLYDVLLADSCKET